MLSQEISTRTGNESRSSKKQVESVVVRRSKASKVERVEVVSDERAAPSKHLNYLNRHASPIDNQWIVGGRTDTSVKSDISNKYIYIIYIY